MTGPSRGKGIFPVRGGNVHSVEVTGLDDGALPAPAAWHRQACTTLAEVARALGRFVR